MKGALAAYLRRVAIDGDHEAGVVTAARAVADRPWDVVQHAGLLARCRMVHAEADMGLTATLRKTTRGGSRSVADLDQGQPYPSLDHHGRRSRGAFDTPVEMARRVVGASLAAAEGGVRTGLDTACGTGAFLLAMHEAGVPEVFGTDLDEVALQVAQVAIPRARLLVEDALKHGPTVDMVVGNPPFVPPERQDKALRLALRRRFPWLKGRFDLVVPFASTAAERARQGGSVGLVLPAPMMVQPYGAILRRRWVSRHQITELSGPHPFPGAAVDVMLVVMRVEGGPAPLPVFGIDAGELLRLDNVPLNPLLMPGDVEIVEEIRRNSVPLGGLCVVDTGLVAHGPEGGKERLLSDEAGDGLVAYADASDFFAGRRRWLDYRPDQMHRAKSPEMFENPKIVIQRLRGKGPIRAAIDWDGVYVGHTCTVVRPRDGAPPLERLLELVRSPVIDAITRIERGERLDLYPRDVAAFPVPTAWTTAPDAPLDRAFGLTAEQLERLGQLAAR